LHKWVVRGRMTERALLLAGIHAGVIKQELERQHAMIDQLPFNSDRKYAAALVANSNAKNILYVLGAPESIIAAATKIDVDGRHEKIAGSLATQLLHKLETLTAQGLRVVACAYRDINTDTSYQHLGDLATDLTLVGFIALKDPVRPDVAASLKVTHQAGIRTIIVTGDHPLTARAIAHELGMAIPDDQVFEGGDIELLDDPVLQTQVTTAAIYARVSPKHKLRIVNALQANGEIVAMVGDGVNDAPALKQADIGVTVGNGTDVAKEVADIVLLDNSFTTIVKAIEQGRIMFENIRKVFTYLVADDFSELFLFIASMAMGLPLPLLAAQILWINLVEDGLPDIALTTEQEANNIMRRPPRRPDEPILNAPLRHWMTAIFFISGLAALLSWLGFWYSTNDIHYTRTAVFALMGLDSMIFAFCVRSFHRTVFRRDIFSNRFLTIAVIISILLLLAALYVPFLQKVLSTQPLRIADWLVIIGISLVELVFIEFAKKRIFR
ncbi:MAG: HAD-IC family P-type ATPase, partial [Candidatus Andersenbacteria bacterium]